MKFTKKIYLLLTFIITYSIVVAREEKKPKWNFAIGLGINKSIPAYTDGVFAFETYQSAIGLDASLGIVYNLSKIFSLNSGVNYQNVNYKVEGSVSYYNSKSTDKYFHYLQIPLGVGVKIGKHLIIDFNPSYSILVDANEKGSYSHNSDPFGPPFISSKPNTSEMHNISHDYLISGLDLTLGLTIKISKHVAFSINATQGIFNTKKANLNSYGYDDLYFKKELVSSEIKLIF